MKYILILTTAFILPFVSTCIFAADTDLEEFMYGTGRHLSNKSDLVLRTEITETPKRFATEVGFVEYRIRLAPTTVYKQHQKYAQGKDLLVSVLHWDTTSQLPDLLKKGSDVILFLKNTPPGGPARIEWVTSDLWFGVQPYNPVLEEIITRKRE